MLRIKEQLNEDGSELDPEFRANSPATHGIFQNILLMDGERILEAEPTIGYIHRAGENCGKPSFSNNTAYG
jgi:NADH-quinone oxidoreductase subunit D